MNDFILISRWTGRFGNRMHQYAYGLTYSHINQVDFYTCSEWEGSVLFAKPSHRVFPDESCRFRLNQMRSQQSEEYRQNVLNEYLERFGEKIVNLEPESDPDPYRKGRYSYFNSICASNQKIFDRMSRHHLREALSFSDEVKRLDVYKRLEDIQGTYDIAHLRRDDVANPNTNKCNYSVISIESYKRAFKKYGVDERQVMWVSDDYTNQWAKQLGFEVDRNRLGWSYPAGSGYSPNIMFDWLADFLKLYFARTIFRANSSFSWWAALLSPTGTVYSPRLTDRKLYGQDGLVEINVEFEEGNQPHWVHLDNSKCPDIRIRDHP